MKRKASGLALAISAVEDGDITLVAYLAAETNRTKTFVWIFDRTIPNSSFR